MFNKTKELLQLLKLPTNPQTIRTLDAAFGGGGCDDFTLTVEALAFVGPESEDDSIVTSASNQEYFIYNDELKEAIKVVVPWKIFQETTDVLPSLNIKIDRSCCKDAIQIELVGENIADLNLSVPTSFEVPEEESAIMIPFTFSSEASFGPKIIGVQAIGCGQNKIKDLYFEYVNSDDTTCPEFIKGQVSVYNNFGTWFNLFIYSEVGGDYEVVFYINGIEARTTSGYTNGNGELIEFQVSPRWDATAEHSLEIKFTPYEFTDGKNCGSYCMDLSNVGSFDESFTLYPCEPYYGMAAIGEDILLKKNVDRDSNVTVPVAPIGQNPISEFPEESPEEK